MPQMSPMNWSLLFIYSIMLLLFMNSLLYFFYFPNLNLISKLFYLKLNKMW